MIDDRVCPFSERIRAAIGELSDQPIRFIAYTHWHPDHTGGNEHFGKSGSLIVSHENIRKRLTVATYNDRMTFHLNGDEISILHVAHAHTDGDSLVHFHKANVIHTGDTYFSGMYPFVHVDSGGRINGLIKAVDTVLELADDKTVIIPGPGPLLDRPALAKWRDMLVSLRDRVAEAIKAGTSVDELLADWLTADYDEDYSGGTIGGEDFIKAIYRSLSQGASPSG